MEAMVARKRLELFQQAQKPLVSLARAKEICGRLGERGLAQVAGACSELAKYLQCCIESVQQKMGGSTECEVPCFIDFSQEVACAKCKDTASVYIEIEDDPVTLPATDKAESPLRRVSQAPAETSPILSLPEQMGIYDEEYDPSRISYISTQPLSARARQFKSVLVSQICGQLETNLAWRLGSSQMEQISRALAEKLFNHCDNSDKVIQMGEKFMVLFRKLLDCPNISRQLFLRGFAFNDLL